MKAIINIQSVVRESEKAMLVRFNNSTTGWLPKSQIDYTIENLSESVEMPQWLAYKLVDAGNISRIDF